MTPKLRYLVSALVLALASHSSWADLTNSTYLSAKEAYSRQEWSKAHQLLQKYLSEDRAYLEHHPTVSAAISRAIWFCEYSSQRESIEAAARRKESVDAAGAEIDRPPEPPTLP